LKITTLNYFKDGVEGLLEDLDINDIFTEDEIIEFISKNYQPEDVFSRFQLKQWADNNV